MSEEEIVLRLDRTTAGYLLGALYDLGEHLAAGVPIRPTSPDENEKLGRLIVDLRRALATPSEVQQRGTAADDSEPDREQPE